MTSPDALAVQPRVPAIAERLALDTVQLHSSAYRTRGNLPDGPVLVVGGGNTGYQIAEELSRTRSVHLSIARARRRCRSASPAATFSATSKPPA